MPLTLACYTATCMLKVLLTSKGSHFEFICVTMPDLEPPLEESGYRPVNLHIL